jgi:hypothetical protein
MRPSPTTPTRRLVTAVVSGIMPRFTQLPSRT